jgi:hypothetical protein
MITPSAGKLIKTVKYNFYSALIDFFDAFYLLKKCLKIVTEKFVYMPILTGKK